MRIRLNTLMAGPGGVHQRGAEIEVPSEVGEALLRHGAERADVAPAVLWPVEDQSEAAVLDERTETATRQHTRGRKWRTSDRKR